jgi:hypothetical protein
MCGYLLKHLHHKLVIFLSNKYYHEIVKVKVTSGTPIIH